MRKIIIDLVFFLIGVISVTVYVQFVDPNLGDNLGPILGAIVLPILVGISGPTVLSGNIAIRILLSGTVFPAAICVSWLLDLGEPRDSDSGVFVVLVILWTGAVSAASAWIVSSRTQGSQS